jgi:hypothetical protein
MPLQHVVKRGDSLWGLAGRHLGNYARWPELVAYHNGEVRKSGGNRGRVFSIKDPNAIFVGQILYLPIRDKRMLSTVKKTGTKQEASKNAIPIDLRVEYAFGKSGRPIIYKQQLDNQAIAIEMRGKITVEVTSPDRFRHNLELLMSKDEGHCKQKLKQIYNPAIIQLTAKPKISVNSGVLMINLPIEDKSGNDPNLVKMSYLKGKIFNTSLKPKSFSGNIDINGRSFNYSAELELKVNIQNNHKSGNDESAVHPECGFLSSSVDSLGKGIKSLQNTFSNKAYQKEIGDALVQTREIVLATHAATTIKGGVILAIATAGPVLTTVMVAAGTPQGQYYLEGILDSLSPMMPTTLIGSAIRIIQELYPRIDDK